MKSYQWLSKFSQSTFGKKSRNKRRRIRKRALVIESLEPRNLLATVSFNGAFLNFQADAGQADVVSVSETSDGALQIQVGRAIRLSSWTTRLEILILFSVKRKLPMIR